MDRLEFNDTNEVIAHYAKKLYDAPAIKTTNDINSDTYKNTLGGEAIQQFFVIKNPKNILGTWDNHKFHKWWMYGELLSEVLNLDPPIMYKYKPKMFGEHYDLLEDGRMQYSYGSRWQEFNQIVNTYNRLKENPNSKRAVVPIFTPYDTEPGRRDAPCTTGYNFIHRDGKLNMTTNYRSWDFFGGAKTYDFALSSFMLQSLASWLDMDVGNLGIHVNSFHYYNKDQEKLEALVDEVSSSHKKSDVLNLDGNLNISDYYKEIRKVKLSEEMSHAKNFEEAEKIKDSLTSELFKDMCNVWEKKNGN